jgi:hypothetical protein
MGENVKAVKKVCGSSRPFISPFCESFLYTLNREIVKDHNRAQIPTIDSPGAGTGQTTSG